MKLLMLKHRRVALLGAILSLASLAICRPAHAQQAPSTLAPGGTLTPGQYIESPLGQYILIQATDGDLILYTTTGEGAPSLSNHGQKIWDSGYHGASSNYFTVIQSSDGNLVTYVGTPSAVSYPVWASGTYGNPGAFLQIKDAAYTTSFPTVSFDPNADEAQIVSGTRTLWANGMSFADSQLLPNQDLTQGQFLTSPAGNCFLIQQSDGNLVLYNGTPANPGSYIWASANYQAQGSYFLAMQTDGNLVTYAGSPDAPGGYEWASGTYGNPNTYLQVTNTKEVQLIDNGNVIWQRP